MPMPSLDIEISNSSTLHKSWVSMFGCSSLGLFVEVQRLMQWVQGGSWVFPSFGGASDLKA